MGEGGDLGDDSLLGKLPTYSGSTSCHRPMLMCHGDGQRLKAAGGETDKGVPELPFNIVRSGQSR